MPGGNSDVVPPESIPNSEVKHVSVDGSVGLPHVRVEHRQAPNSEKGSLIRVGLFCMRVLHIIPVTCSTVIPYMDSSFIAILI